VPAKFFPDPLRASFVLGALLLAASAVTRRLREAGQELEERFTSAALMAVASLVALLAWTATPEEWDSIRMLFTALAALGLFGSFVILLPRVPRRIVASILILFHFGGIATAVTAVAPRAEPPPWLATMLWVRLYRPYLQFMYLTNAYHFYSPDPGPPSLLWLRVRFADNTAVWVRFPLRSASPIALNYQRMLALAESTNPQQQGIPPKRADIAEYEKRMGKPFNHEAWEDIVERRQKGGATCKEYALPLYLPADLAAEGQFNEPNEFVKRLISSYARHVARTTRHPTNPDMEVEDVRVYRITHRIISPSELARGYSPLTVTLYSPYYQGKFNRDGELLDPLDPLLYWYVPIVIVPKSYGTPGVPLLLNHQPSLEDGMILNGLVIHSGDPNATPGFDPTPGPVEEQKKP
jgi:hypothetical protein